MDDNSDDDDDHLSTINLTPSEANTGASDEYGFSHDEDDDPLDASTAANAADDGPSGVPENEDESSLTDSDAEGAHAFRHAAPEYRWRFNRVHLKSRERKRAIEQLNARIIQLEARKRQLEDRIVRLSQPRNTLRKTQVTWPDRIGSESWETIYKLSCLEGNASPKLTKLHPDLNLRRPTNRELQADLLQDDLSEHQRPRPFDMLAGKTPRGNVLRGKLPTKIPDEVQFQILRHFFDFRGKVVHAISRLDPHHPLDEAPMNRNQRPSYLHRLHVGRTPVSIQFAPDPNVFLAPLLGRFAKGIRANVQRLQHIQIFWQGSQHLTFEINDRGKYTSRRTFALVWLPEAIRLKTLGVYVQESNEEYMRRQHEPRGIVEHMKCKMQIHPNFRGFRSLRTIQGMDYVYNLRGLDQAEFWDFDRWLHTKERKRPVRDWHFIKDVNNSVRRPKEAADRYKSQLRNLFPSLNSFEPSDADWEILLRGLGVVEENSPEDSSSDSDPDSGSDENSDDDGDDDAPSQAIPWHNMRDNSSNIEEDSGPSTGDSQANDLLNNFHLLRLMAINSDGDQDSDDGSATVVPDDRSVSGHQVIDLTEDEDNEDQSNQELDQELDQGLNQELDRELDHEIDHEIDHDINHDINHELDHELDQELDQDIASSEQGSTNGNVEGSLFVDDDGYAPSYTESHTRSTQGNRSTGGCGSDSDDPDGSDGSNISPPRTAESEASLFTGSAPSYIYRTASSTTTRRQNERNDIELIDLTEEDPTDQFLPEKSTASSDSRKRDHLKLEEDEEDKGDGGASGGAKRLCT
ncbi:hypothetical protein J3E68DRAFT_434359 [Trichoderma sp. SZMC 28012]